MRAQRIGAYPGTSRTCAMHRRPRATAPTRIRATKKLSREL